MTNYRYIFVTILCGLALVACGDSDTTQNTASTSEPQPASTTASTAATTPASAASSTTAEASEVEVSSVMAKGKEVYLRNCVACHQPNGQGIPPAFPSIAGSAVVQGELTGQISLILNGVPGTAMVAFGPQLTDEEIAAVVTYQRNSFGNNTGDEATAEQVKAQR